jgi:sulfotransferase family protein
MIARFAAGIKYIFGLHHPGRNLAVLPDDVFLVSYPKSGNTWCRFLIANLAYPQRNPDWGNIDQLIPGPEVATKRFFQRMQRPRIIHSHDPFDPRYKQVIYIVRDPRDVALSQYHHHQKRKLIDESYPFDKFLPRFLAGETNEHGSWKQNVAGWLAARYGDPRFLLLRYEDMIACPQSELGRVAEFLGVAATPQDLARSVEQSSPERMRQLEKINADKNALTKGTRQDLPFVRTAKFGNWKSEMQESSIAAIEAAWAPLMKWLGYELVSREPRLVEDFAFLPSERPIAVQG